MSITHRTTEYDGIFLRDALGETNSLPRRNAQTTSPDVINAGTTPSTDPQADFGDTYKSEVGVDLVYGEDNNIYVRGMNYGTAQIVGSASLYWSYQTQLSNPSTWQQLTTQSGANTSPVAANAGDVAVTQTPFVWAPTQPSSGNPYVLIAVIASPDNPNPVPDYIASIEQQSFEDWQAGLGGVAALTMKVPTPPKTKATYSLTGLMNVGNDDTEKVSFSLQLSDAVVGDHISLSVDKDDANGQPMGFTDMEVSKPDMTTGFQGDVPAGFSSSVTFEYTASDTTKLPHPTLTMQATRTISSGGGDGGDPFNPNHGNTQTVIVAQFVLTTAAGS